MELEFKSFIVSFLILLFVNVFGAIYVKDNYLFLILLPFIVLNLPKKTIFKKNIYIVFCGLFLSILSCYYYRGQELLYSFWVIVPFLFIGFYFVLWHFNLPINKIETLLYWISLFFCFCYILQYSIYPKALFKGADDRADFDQDIRIRMIGQGFSSLGYFFGLNKFLKDSKKIHFLILSVLCFVTILLMGFRTMLGMILIFSIVLFIRIKGFKIKLIISGFLMLLILIGLLQLPVFSSIIERMVERSETQTFLSEDYVRNIEFNYFTKSHFKSGIEYFFGSGIPAVGGSEYGRYMERLFESTPSINYADLGLLSLSWMVGIITVLAMIAYSIKAITIKVESNYFYVSTWFLYLLSVSFTTADYFRPGSFIVQSVALYLVEKANNELSSSSIKL